MLIQAINETAIKYSIEQLKIDNPNVSFPAHIPESLLAEYNCFNAIATEKPTYDKVLENRPQYTFKLIEGVWTQVWTVAKKSLLDAQSAKKQQMKQARKSATESTCTVKLNATNYVFDCDSAARSAIHQAIDNAGLAQLPDTATTQWKLADDSFIEISCGDLKLAGLQIATFIQAQYTNEAQKIAEIDAATTIDQLRQINWE